MPTTTTYEMAVDSAGLITETTTEEAFSEIQLPEFGGNLRGARVTQSDGKWTLVREEYMTNGSAVYSADASTSTEPIESHPMFDQIRQGTEFQKWTVWKANHTDPSLDGWLPNESTEALVHNLYWWYLSGITSYLAPRCVIKHSTIEDEFPNITIVGKIANPGTTGDWPGNFICTAVNCQQEGGKYRVTVEYMASAQGREWDPQIYS